MGALLKIIILLYLLSLLFSMFIALIRFFIDVAKWHDKENKVKIVASNSLESEVIYGRRNYSTGERTGDGTGDSTGDSNIDERTDCSVQPLQFGE